MTRLVVILWRASSTVSRWAYQWLERHYRCPNPDCPVGCPDWCATISYVTGNPRVFDPDSRTK